MPSADASPELAKARRVGRAVESWGRLGLRALPWRTCQDPYRTVVVEVLLQQTPASRVAAFYDSFFIAYPDWTTLASAPVGELEVVLRPLGLHRRRADVLRRLARSVLEAPELPLRDRPGIGQYVERAVAVSLRGARLAMIDTNYVRVARRVFHGPWASDYRYDRRLQELGLAMVLASSDPRIANWAILDLGATVCRPTRPACEVCPLVPECAYGGANAFQDRVGHAGA